MDRRCALETDSTVASQVGRGLVIALEIACKAAVTIVGMALFIGMVSPRDIVSEAPGSPPTTRVEVHEEGNNIRIVPRYSVDKGFPRLILHDAIGQEMCTIEYPRTGPAFFFDGASTRTPIRLNLWVKPGAAVFWEAVGQRATAGVAIGADGSADVSVRGTGDLGREIGRIRVPAEGKPTVSSAGP